MVNKITFDTYPVTLYVFVGESDKDILAYIESNNLNDYEDLLPPLEDNEEARFCYEEGSSSIYLKLRDITKPEIIAHESLHAAAYILRHVGVRFTKASEEAYAYLLQYIVENIYN